MARAKELTVKNFKGIDRRQKIQSGDAQNLWDAKNLDLTRGGDLRCRDELVKVAELPEASIGLYSFGGQLRCAVPSGHGLEDLAPVGFKFDVISNTDGITPIDRYDTLYGVESWGADDKGDPQPYLVLGAGNAREHHFIDGEAITRVTLPFKPGKDVVKIQNKIYSATTDGLVHYSSTLNGPRDWVEPDDAGFVDALNNSRGTANITGLTFYQNQLVVFFLDSVQFWQVSPDPNQFQLLRVLNGPGTELFNSVSPVVGDLYYFSLGGFHSLQATNVLGETREGDIGAAIEPITKDYLTGYTTESLWSAARSQYLCFFSDEDSCRVFVRTNSVLGGVDGWTYWDLEVPVDYVTENGGELYVRVGNDVYQFVEPEYGDTLNYEWSYETMMIDGNKPARMKQWNSLDIEQEGQLDKLEFRVDTQDPSKLYTGYYNVTGDTTSLGSFPVVALSHKLGLKVVGSKYNELSSFTVRYFELNGAG